MTEFRSCLNCGAESPDEAGACHKCGRPFASATAAGETEWILTRPSGSAPIGFGFGAMVLGVLAVLLACIVPESSGYPPEPDPWHWRFIWIGAGLLQLGLLLWGIGQIQRAIYFLPGDEQKKRP